MRGQLLVIAGPDQGRTFFLDEGQTALVGRGLNTEARLTDPQVSRAHCQVRLAGGRLHLTDSGSSSGTLVNGRRVVEHDVGPGETFQVGGTCIRFELESVPEATTVVTSGRPPFTADLADVRYRHLKSHVEQGALVLTLVESQILDDDLAEAVRLEMLAAVAHAGVPRVVVDFHAVKSVSSAIFRPLISLQGRLREHGGRLVLCGLTVMVGQVLHMCGLIEGPGTSSPCFETEPDLAAALARVHRAE
jgi:anti-anti-sigma factor